MWEWQACSACRRVKRTHNGMTGLQGGPHINGVAALVGVKVPAGVSLSVLEGRGTSDDAHQLAECLMQRHKVRQHAADILATHRVQQVESQELDQRPEVAKPGKLPNMSMLQSTARTR